MKSAKSILVFSVPALLLCTGAAGATQPAPLMTDTYLAALQPAVDEGGWVDYAALSAHPEKLREFLADVAGLSPGVYGEWSEADQIAFWINAYNALTLRLIVDHYPIAPSGKASEYPANSIRQIPGAWDGVTFYVMGEEMTLDHIENEVLRKRFDEPRIHMALVCAAASCPPLRAEPYEGKRLDEQLEDQTRRFLASPERFSIDREKGVVRLSSIFDWFGDDFVKQYGREDARFDPKRAAVIAFVARHVSSADREFLENGKYRVEYLPYDWTLNERTK